MLGSPGRVFKTHSVYLRLLHGMLLEAAHIGKGAVEASGGSHQAVAVCMGGIGIHGRLLLWRRPGGKGCRSARDLHYVSSGLVEMVKAQAQPRRRSWG